MDKLTQLTPKGASLILDNPKTEEEARAQVKKRFMMACNKLYWYEKTELMPEEVFDALQSATKLISTMRNNKKAALWLKKYGEDV